MIGFLGMARPGHLRRLSPRSAKGTERNRLRRWPERDDRIPLGGRAIRSTARIGSRSRRPAKVDVIVTSGGPPSARAAKNASSTIPIVFIASDPIELGLVTSLARPGGNLTGVSTMLAELTAKRLEFLSELVPQAKMIVLLVNPSNQSNAQRITGELLEAAREKGPAASCSSRPAASARSKIAFAALAQLRAGALLLGNDGFFGGRRDQLVALASCHAVPAIYDSREYAASGGLISYGASIAAVYRQLGTYAGRILKGAKPGDLPIQQPDKFDLVINLKTAKALGTHRASIAARPRR